MKKDLQEQIFNLLHKHLSYDEKVIKAYAGAASVRFCWSEAETVEQVNELISAQNSRLFGVITSSPEVGEFPNSDICLFKLNGYSQRQELCYLDAQNLRAFLRRNLNPEMKSYLSVLQKEIEYRGLFAPSAKMIEAEHRMLEYIGNVRSDENKEYLVGIANATLRVIMQEWLLYPELVSDEQGVKEIIDCLELFNCIF